MGDTNNNNIDNSYKTSNSTYMAAILALLGQEPDPDKWIKIETGNKRHKAVAVYSNRSGLPSLSEIKLVCGDKEASLNDFKYAFSVIRDRINDVIYDRNLNRSMKHE